MGASSASNYGKIYFGGPGGVSYTDPLSIAINQVPPKLSIVEVTSIDGLNNRVKVGFATDSIKVYHNTQTLEIGFVGLSFIKSEKNQYKGGELLIENLNAENEFKLNLGEILIYPSTYLHSVQEVLNGERIVCVGWIESYIKSIEEREYLFDLDAGARGLLAKHGRSDELDIIFKSYSNLLRVLGN